MDDERVMDIVKRYRKTTIGYADYNTFDDINFYNLGTRNIDISAGDTNTINLRKQAADNAVKNKGFIVWYGHRMIDGAGEYEGEIKNLMELVDYALDKVWNLRTL